MRWSEAQHGHVCQDEASAGDLATICETEPSWLEAYPPVCVLGTCYVMAKAHAIEL